MWHETWRAALLQLNHVRVHFKYHDVPEGKWANYDKSQGQLSTRLVKIIDFITNLIRSGDAARCSSIISDCSDYNRIWERYTIFHILSFGTPTKSTGSTGWQAPNANKRYNSGPHLQVVEPKLSYSVTFPLTFMTLWVSKHFAYSIFLSSSSVSFFSSSRYFSSFSYLSSSPFHHSSASPLHSPSLTRPRICSHNPYSLFTHRPSFFHHHISSSSYQLPSFCSSPSFYPLIFLLFSSLFSSDTDHVPKRFGPICS